MKNILVLGGYGFLGSYLCPFLDKKKYNVFRQGRKTFAQIYCNPLDQFELLSAIKKCSPDVIVNLIANTNVDECEDDLSLAYTANVKVVESIVGAMKAGSEKIHLINISSDMVYSGDGPHLENNVSPINVYGLSKLAAEFLATQVGACNLRTNFFGRSRNDGRKSLTDWFVNSLEHGKPITVFEDNLISALHISTVCQAIELVCLNEIPGTYNLGCSDGGSKADLAFGLAAKLGLDCELMVVGKIQNANFRARRPLDMRMNSRKFSNTFQFEAPSFESQIDEAVQEYKEG